MERDQTKHLAAVRHMFETLDVFVFTLGLTEGWEAVADGAAFPICPGVQADQFDPGRYRFFNQTVAEVVGDLAYVLAGLKSVYPKAETILTVSPVPLVATAEARHVLTSTVASKAVLRAAVDELERAHANVHYFPSFEIVTCAPNAARAFEDDLRSVTDEVVAQVMKVLFKAATNTARDGESAVAPSPKAPVKAKIETLFETVCDEEALARTDLSPPSFNTPTSIPRRVSNAGNLLFPTLGNFLSILLGKSCAHLESV